MNATQEAALADDLADAIERAGMNNVVELNAQLPADAEMDRHADFHRRAAAAYDERRADARKLGRERLTALKAERKALKDIFAADMAGLAESEADAKLATATEIAVAERLARASRAALREIEQGQGS